MSRLPARAQRHAAFVCNALLAAVATGAEPGIIWNRVGPGEDAAGAAVRGDLLLTWGARTALRTLPGGTPARIAGPSRAAALIDIDGDGRLDVVVSETDPLALAWYAAPRWMRHAIEAGVEAHDLQPATLGGRRGLLLIHKRSQLRFYTVPPRGAGEWAARDLYSIYTPSWQGGLAFSDVDGDGAVDILAGNYWLRAPASYELPWRLFAINTWTEEEPSGVLSLALVGRGVAAAQRELASGRVALFEPPEDPRKLWTERPLGVWNRPGLAAADFDGDGRIDLAAGERGHSGRVLLFEAPGYTPRVVRSGVPVVALHPPGGRRLLLLTRESLEYGTVHPR